MLPGSWAYASSAADSGIRLIPVELLSRFIFTSFGTFFAVEFFTDFGASPGPPPFFLERLRSGSSPVLRSSRNLGDC
jgi:hypothetical protein